MKTPSFAVLAIAGIVVSILLPCTVVAIMFGSTFGQPAETITEDYTGKVIQVDHVTTTSSGLFFGSSSRTDTYVTFDNGQTYWATGYIVIIEGYTYHVHTVKIIQYGTGLNSTAFQQGSVTTTINTFTEVSGK
jgi:hypothetical protein